jgi:ligand-binding sensor domain-containing protein
VHKSPYFLLIHSNFIFHPVPSLIQKSGGSEVRTLFEDSKHRLWVADKEGKIQLFSQEGKSLGFLRGNGTLSPRMVQAGMVPYDLLQDRKGRIWFACKGKGLVMLEEKPSPLSFKITSFNDNLQEDERPNSSNFYALLEDHEGRIWAGSYGGGLHLVDESNGRIRFIHPSNGLDSYPYEHCRYIRDLAEDKQGIIWIATINGLVAFDSQFGSLHDIPFMNTARKVSIRPAFGPMMCIVYTLILKEIAGLEPSAED